MRVFRCETITWSEKRDPRRFDSGLDLLAQKLDRTRHITSSMHIKHGAGHLGLLSLLAVEKPHGDSMSVFRGRVVNLVSDRRELWQLRYHRRVEAANRRSCVFEISRTGFWRCCYCRRKGGECRIEFWLVGDCHGFCVCTILLVWRKQSARRSLYVEMESPYRV
jgi:hypothetical protein